MYTAWAGIPKNGNEYWALSVVGINIAVEPNPYNNGWLRSVYEEREQSVDNDYYYYYDDSEEVNRNVSNKNETRQSRFLRTFNSRDVPKMTDDDLKRNLKVLKGKKNIFCNKH